MINGDGYQRESRKENGSYKMVSLFNRVVKKSLTEKMTFKARKQEPSWEQHSRQREQ